MLLTDKQRNEIKELQKQQEELQQKIIKKEDEVATTKKASIREKGRRKLNKWKRHTRTRQNRIDRLEKALPVNAEQEEKFREIVGKYQALFSRELKVSKEPRHVSRPQTIEDLYEKFGQDLKKANRAGRQMASFVLSPRASHVEKFQTEGVLDAGQLASIVAEPFGYAAETPYLKRHEKFGQQLDTAITLLVDKSGSMSGEKIAMAYIAAERLGYWLSTAGIQMEVLSYTSNDFRIYKSFSEPHKPTQTKDVMAGMLDGKSGGTPTGEGTVWAHDRLLSMPNKRKILMVLTDGQSNGGIDVDDINDWIETESPVELAGVGIIHDVSPHYDRHIYVEKPSDLITSVAAQIKAMMDRPHESHRRVMRAPRSAAQEFDLKITPERRHKPDNSMPQPT